MKILIRILLFVVASYNALGSETELEVYKGSIKFKDAEMVRFFTLANRVPVLDEPQVSILRGISELEIMGKVEVSESSRPWVGEPLYLVVLENNKQTGRIIQIYSEHGKGELSIFEGTRSDNETLLIDFNTCQKFKSKTFERLLLKIVTSKAKDKS